MIMSAQEINAAVSAKLESLYITFIASYAGEQTKENNWKCDAWRITFKRGAQSFFKKFDTDYFTGTRLRESKRQMPKDIARLRPNILARVEWEKHNLKPVAPSAASVLHSLLSDGEAINTSFKYWCADYGYDSDSISALNTYNACCAVGEKVNAFFSHSEREELNKLLEDY
jgi:hypothetical protein